MARIAVAQTDPRIADVDTNLERITRVVADVAAQGVDLVVFPECATTGYMYESLDEAFEVAQSVPGAISDCLCEVAAQHNIHVIAGQLERVGDRCFNTAVLAGPQGLIAQYRKTHVLCLGVDRFTTPGDLPYAVFTLPFCRLGMLICYDLRFPETARLLALQGAQIIALPTNWPVTSNIQADVFTRARAAENRVFVLAADRVGIERGAQFLGRSQIVGPDGGVIEEAGVESEQVLVATIDPADADAKRVVVKAGAHEMDCFVDRRPELYGPLTV